MKVTVGLVLTLVSISAMNITKYIEDHNYNYSVLLNATDEGVYMLETVIGTPAQKLKLQVDFDSSVTIPSK